ncbi:MAG: hypothetical protein ACYCYR_09460 [Desulfobulbaceae bacterium]
MFREYSENFNFIGSIKADRGSDDFVELLRLLATSEPFPVDIPEYTGDAFVIGVILNPTLVASIYSFIIVSDDKRRE